MSVMDYESWLDPFELEGYVKGKRVAMRLARIGKQVVAEMVDGTIEPGKSFLHTPVGRYRLANRANSDNTTERRAHQEAGVRTIILNDAASLGELFREHGFNVSVALREFEVRVRREMHDADRPGLF